MITNITAQDCTEGTGYGEHQPIGRPVRVGHWEQTVWVRDGGLGLASQAVVEGTLANEKGEYKKKRADENRGEKLESRAEIF